MCLRENNKISMENSITDLRTILRAGRNVQGRGSIKGCMLEGFYSCYVGHHPQQVFAKDLVLVIIGIVKVFY